MGAGPDLVGRCGEVYVHTRKPGDPPVIVTLKDKSDAEE